MKMAGRLLAAALLSLAAGCQGAGDETQPASQLGTQEAKAESCVQRFDGITSCATGNATLTPTERGLSVSGLVNPREDGVSSNFAGAVRWTQEAQIGRGDGQGNFSLAARDGSQVVSTLRVTPGREPNQLSLAPSFTGGAVEQPSYMVNVYRAGQLVDSTVYSPDRYIIIWWDWWWWWWLHWDFHIYRAVAANMSNDGACVWRMRMGDGTFRTMINGREVVGDSIEFVEQIQDGAYPYTSFSGIDVRGNAKEYTILGESVARQ